METETLHGKYIYSEEVRSEETWGWIKKGHLKKESERLIFAARTSPKNELDKKEH